MKRRVGCVVVSLVLAWSSLVAAQDLFERALQVMTDQVMVDAGLDHGGILLRGGFEVGYPAPLTKPAIPALDIGTLLSSLGIGEGLMRDLEKLLDPNAIVGSVVSGFQDAVNDLMTTSISNLPMVTACYAGPTLCDISKHQQDLAMMTQQGALAVQEMGSNLLGGLSSKLKSSRVQKCIDDARRPGAGGAVNTTLAEAQEACAGALAGGIIDPADGVRKASVDLIGGSLDRANAPAEVKTFADEVIGEVTIEQGASNAEPLKTTIARPSKGLHDVFQEEKDDLVADLEAAVVVVAGGGTLTAAEMRELSLPGAPMPGAVIEALADMSQSDPLAYAGYRNKLAGNMALIRLNWRVHELQEHLDESVLTNQELGEPEAEVIRQRQERLRREMRRVVEQKEMAERHVLPVMESMVADHRESQREAARRGMQAPADLGGTDNQWGRQNGIGYSY